MDIRKDFGKRLKQLRIEECVTQKQLAKEIGVSESDICRYEKGERNISIERLWHICKVFDISADYLLGLKN